MNVAFNEIFQSAVIWRARRFWAMTGAGKDMGRSVAANWRKRAWRGLFLAAVLGLSARPVGAQAAAPAPAAAAEVFTVADVPVDATAASANVARDTARLAGERIAYRMLLARLTLARDADRLPAASDAMLTDLVQGFEVAKERTSTVRYLAEYAFRFRPDGIRQLLRQARVPFAETPSKPLVVLPVLVADRGPALWEDPNPWRAAWNQKKFVTGLVPMILPLGEVEDLAAIDADLALKGDAAAIGRISARDGNADVLVTVAMVKGAGDGATLDVKATRYSPGNPGGEPSWSRSYAATPGDDWAALMQRGVLGTVDQINEAWKAANVLDFSQTSVLTVSVPLSGLRDWVTVSNRLGTLPAVAGVNLLSIDRDAAQIAIRYVGDLTQLRMALAQRDLELSGEPPSTLAYRGTTQH